ncbi:MAG: hypothetical protein J6C01_03140, partial [Lachnospiraceae bacterium]|nr:hypothetical protein [Lachnospiraceae bacterium]
MQQKKNRLMSFLQWTLWILMVISILYFILGELLMPSEKMYLDHECSDYNDEWSQVLPDGTRQAIVVPGECDVKPGDVLCIEKKLSRIQNDTWICIRSSQQDISVYVGDELREQYSTKNTRGFGKNSVSVYVFFPLYEEDAGKTLRMEIVSNSPYSGYVNEMYEGERSNIWQHFFQLYLPGTLVALFMMLLSFAVVVYSNILHYITKRRMEILYLGSGLLMASLWLIAESRLRQVILPNSTIASDVGFLMVMLLPYPFLTYSNLIQKRRYQGIYMLIAILAIINCVVSTLLQVLDVKDFSETMGYSHLILIVLIMVLIVTVCLDAKRGYIKEYLEVSVGMVGLMLAGIYEIYLVYDKSSLYNGIALCIGLVFLLLMAGIKTGRDIMSVEKEKQMAVMANESKDKFLANMSHEIRTPINTVIGMNEMILRENKDNTIQEYAKNIQSASRMLLSLINDVLDFSKIEAGKLEVTENPYHLSSLLNDVIMGIKVRAQNKKLSLHLNIDENMPAVLKGDEIRIRQIMNNLLSNAVKYTSEGSITFSAKGVQNDNRFMLEVSVQDTGNGIKKEDMARLFDSFQRLELNKNRYIEGTGLGLSITKQLVNQMQGSIDVQSEYGKGSCFTVCIPQEVVDSQPMGDLEKAYKNAATSQGTIEKQEEKKHLYAPNASVLVVDDNKMNLTVVKALLKRSAIQLDFAMGGEEC